MLIDVQRNGSRKGESIRYPDVYKHVLRKVCERTAFDPAAFLSLELEGEFDEIAWVAECGERVIAPVKRRNGETIIAHSHDLPPDLPSSVLARFPAGGQPVFKVSKDDKVVLLPRLS
jgi:hypothetical protein